MRFLTSRSTVISLFSAVSAALLMASVLPQRSSLEGKTPAWVANLPGSLKFLSTLLELDNIVGSGWFALLVLFFWMSLVVSTISQYSATKALANRLPSADESPGGQRIYVSADAFAELAKQARYHATACEDGVRRYVKNRVGYWGSFLLHVGIVTAVLFSLVYVLTQHRALIRLTAEEITRLTEDNVTEMRGVLPLQQKLPYSIVLKDLTPRFWANDKLESLSSELYIVGHPGDDPQKVVVAVSDKSVYGPYIVYQANAFGRVFDLEFTTADGAGRSERLYLPYPPRRDAAGYGELVIAGTDFLVKGKFYADVERKTMQVHDSPLTLRLFRGKEQLGEVTLSAGAPVHVGPFSVRQVHTTWWTDVMLDGTRGTYGIFAGFALILAGVLASYCLVPREIIVREKDGEVYVQHVARRFAQFYREEFTEIIQKASRTGGV